MIKTMGKWNIGFHVIFSKSGTFLANLQISERSYKYYIINESSNGDVK